MTTENRLSRSFTGFIKRVRGSRVMAHGKSQTGSRLYVGRRGDTKGATVIVNGVASVDEGCLLEGTITLGDGASIGRGCILQAGEDRGGFIRIGEQSIVFHGSSIYGAGGVTVGRQCHIAGGVTLISADRVFDDPERPIVEQGYRCRPIVLEDDVWIGANCVVLAGVTIGRGAVVGAGAVVTRHVEAGDIVAGVPARRIGVRGQSGASADRHVVE